MGTRRKRPIIRVHAHFDGKRPLTEAYADVFALILRSQRKAKSSVHTFEGREPFHYDSSRNHKECDRDGN
jgi:hypothetical protein